MVRVIPFLLVAAVMYWLAAPDPVTAGARTAAGTGVKAAGAGIRDHWSSGRDSRALTRTNRRDRWSKGGGFWRNLLRLEHGAVITGKGVKGAAGITRAAVKPVPAAVKAGWVSGRDRHRAKAGNRPVPVALDPPWWRREQAQVQPGEHAPEQAEEQAGDSPAEQVQASGGHAREQVTEVPGVGEDDPDAYTATTRRLPDGSVRGELFYAGAPEVGEQLLTTIDRASEGDVRREFADIVAETQRDNAWGTPARIAWVPLDEDGRPPSPYGDLRCQWCGERPQETKRGKLAVCSTCGEEIDRQVVATTTDPTAMPTPTEGDPVFTSLDTDLDDLTTVQDFALKVADMAEESDFAQLVEFCKNASDEVRDFGADMAGDVAEFEEVAAKIGDLLSELVDAATKVKERGAELVGG